MTEEIETNLKLPEFKVGDRVRIKKHRKIFNNCFTENWSIEIFMIDSMLQTN